MDTANLILHQYFLIFLIYLLLLIANKKTLSLLEDE
jgi:hypothetical protein